MRFAVAANEFSGRASGEPLMRLDTQSLLHLGNQLEQEVLRCKRQHSAAVRR